MTQHLEETAWSFGRTIGSVESVYLDKHGHLNIYFLEGGNVMLSMLSLMLSPINHGEEKKPIPLITLEGKSIRLGLVLEIPESLNIKKGSRIKLLHVDGRANQTRYKFFKVE